MKDTVTGMKKRIAVINETLKACPDMWPGPKKGFLAERTRLTNQIKKANTGSDTEVKVVT